MPISVGKETSVAIEDPLPAQTQYHDIKVQQCPSPCCETVPVTAVEGTSAEDPVAAYKCNTTQQKMLCDKHTTVVLLHHFIWFSSCQCH